jgi:hypothetical protein
MLPIIMPQEMIVEKAPRGHRWTVKSLCRAADIECRVTGPAAGRRVHLRRSKSLDIFREPGSLGLVSVGVPGGSKKDRAVLALGLLAYVVFDYAARESMSGRPEARFALPVGRPRKARPLSGAERQRRWRGKSR